MLTPKNERSYAWESVPGVDNVPEANSETGQVSSNKNKKSIVTHESRSEVRLYRLNKE